MVDGLGYKIAKLFNSAAVALHVRSALNPMLWLTGIGTTICFFAAYIFRSSETLTTILVVVGTLPIIFTCFGFAYFAMCKPEKLQSEDYQIRHESLQIIQQKSGSIEISEASLNQIANPVAARVENKGRAK